MSRRPKERDRIREAELVWEGFERRTEGFFRKVRVHLERKTAARKARDK
jgi:hypothetical protein